eukprot:TRINITY_DN9829_c0_g1_i1.p2 TRINITY_DN9829_c0_g1~~TRINITY_DN9829_c0_g1_i1.p2  ORF type:complete len:244 (-),score=82.84 TRINITY_DN9829_c0_g1_i1:19-750(-)
MLRSRTPLLRAARSGRLAATRCASDVAGGAGSPTNGAKTAPRTAEQATATRSQANKSAVRHEAPPADVDVPLCNCLKRCSVQRVSKPGHTHGKLFFGCPDFAERPTRGCTYFQWVHDADNATPAASAPASSAELPLVPNGPPCECGKPSLELAVGRAGTNRGRHFYRCASGVNKIGTQNEPPCAFFLWKDPPPTDKDDRTVASGPDCLCGEPSIVLTVSKASPNIGRKFYKCRKGECSYFEWK